MTKIVNDYCCIEPSSKVCLVNQPRFEIYFDDESGAKLDVVGCWMDWQWVVKQIDQDDSRSTEDCFTQDFFVCQEVQVSSLRTLYSWVCVHKCTLKLQYIISLYPSHPQLVATLVHLGGGFLHGLFPITSPNFWEGCCPFRFIYMKKI